MTPQQSQFSRQTEEFLLQFPVLCVYAPRARDDHKVPAARQPGFVQSVDLADPPADPVADHRLAEFCPYGDPQAVRLRPVRQDVENEPGARRALPLVVEPAELVVLFEGGRPLHVTNRREPFCDQADSFALPFARRLASTLRPLAVDILFRKPCSMERWRFLG